MPNQIENIDLLTFRIMKNRYGVDAEQVEKMCNIEDIDKSINNIIWFHEKALPYNMDVFYKAPKVLFIKHNNGSNVLCVDQPEDIVKLPVKNIVPLPPLFKVVKYHGPAWGAVATDDSLILLLDLIEMTN